MILHNLVYTNLKLWIMYLKMFSKNIRYTRILIKELKLANILVHV